MTKSEKSYVDRVASLGCLICKAPAQIHHCGTRMGGGNRDHKKVLPLCVMHHTSGGYGVALHAGKRKWEAIYGTETDLLKQVAMRLAK